MRHLITVMSAAALLAAASWPALAQSQNFTPEELARRTVERRAVEAAIWGMPMVTTYAMRESFFRDAGAKYGDVVYFSKPADWRFQFTTPNASTHYVYFNYNTKEAQSSWRSRRRLARASWAG